MYLVPRARPIACEDYYMKDSLHLCRNEDPLHSCRNGDAPHLCRNEDPPTNKLTR